MVPVFWKTSFAFTFSDEAVLLDSVTLEGESNAFLRHSSKDTASRPAKLEDYSEAAHLGFVTDTVQRNRTEHTGITVSERTGNVTSH